MSLNFRNPGTSDKPEPKQLPKWVPPVLWIAALACVAFMGIVIVQRTPVIRGNEGASSGTVDTALVDTIVSNPGLPEMNALETDLKEGSVPRQTSSITHIPENQRKDAVTYTIEAGDSLYGIANKFDLQPETVLWANYNVLYDDAHNISVGDELIIPPDDGIYVEWKESDQLQRLADKYRVEVKDVLACPVNKLDILDPVIKAGDFILFPGGYRETTAFNPIVYEYSANSGVKKVIAGPGGCAWDYRAFGNGTFIWPTASHALVGNDFGTGHMGVDLATVEGGPIYAADGGTVVYAGPISGGYGIMVMIDHGTGYQSLYAHLSAVAVGCGQGVSQGQMIGYGGSTGNSTGPHLHFEVRYGGGYVNPWQFL